MSLRDFAILVGICVIWASNNIISRIVVTDFAAPPLAYAALRFLVVALVVSPWLLPAPKPLGKLILTAFLMGGGNFALMFIALQTATPSSAAVVLQVGVPMTILMSVIFLKETISWRRGLGIGVTVAGALLVIWDPRGLTLSAGLLLVALSCFIYAIGATMLRTMENIKPLQLQAWVGLSSFVPLAILTTLLERQGWPAMAQHWLGFGAAVIFSALVVSVLAHTFFYGLIQRYDAGLLQPITLMTPLLTIIGGLVITHDHFDGRIAIGAGITLVGVLIIVLRAGHIMPLLAMLRSRS
ncbi:MAG: DMT family transporter [Caulobacteraceae bacterium]